MKGGDSMNNDLANTIRGKVDIVDIIGERIPLTAKGKNYFGVCPFHDDTNPSMSVLGKNKFILVFLVMLQEMFLLF